MHRIPDSHVDLICEPHGCVITIHAPSGLPQSTGRWLRINTTGR